MAGVMSGVSAAIPVALNAPAARRSDMLCAVAADAGAMTHRQRRMCSLMRAERLQLPRASLAVGALPPPRGVGDQYFQLDESAALLRVIADVDRARPYRAAGIVLEREP